MCSVFGVRCLFQMRNDTNGGVLFPFLAHMGGCNSCFVPYDGVQFSSTQNGTLSVSN